MSDMSSHARITRREFVQTGAGLVIGFSLPPRLVPAPRRAEAPFAPNAWVRVGTDGIVTLTVDKSEMGQGSQTGLAMILAEELEADWSKVRLGPVPENAAGWSRRMSTGGSTAVRTSWDPLRIARAVAPALRRTAPWSTSPAADACPMGSSRRAPPGLPCPPTHRSRIRRTSH